MPSRSLAPWAFRLEEIKIIARGAFLHDIGKMAIPDDILRKPGKLTDDEQALMREHCARGYNMLRKIPFLAGAAEIVFCHQEHYDGNGYPNRLAGREIPIGARIFAVADTLDAITSDRPYRKACGFDLARAKEILRCSGTQFDPAVVEVFSEDSQRALAGTSLRNQRPAHALLHLRTRPHPGRLVKLLIAILPENI